jgi:hypothetical protein
MQFLSPMYLFGLLAAGIPILLHFLSRRRPVDIQFGPLRFLRPTQERQMRRLSLRRLLLLLLRVTIICLVVMAAARPTLTGGLARLAPTGHATSVVVLVDASASMQAQLQRGTMFDRARTEVAAIVGQLSGQDEVAVALFSDVVRPLFSEFVRDGQLVLAQLQEARPDDRATDYVTALSGALDLLEKAGSPYREIFVVSDFQEAAADSVRLARLHERLRQSPGTTVLLRAVKPEPFVNRQVADVERPATLLRAGETAEVAVQVRQDGDADLPVQLFLQVGDATVGETELQLAAHGTRRHGFPLTLPAAGDLAGSARLRPDRYPPDDERFFVLPVSQRVNVMVLAGLGAGDGERDPLLFLRAGLDPGESGEGDFALEVVPAERMDVTHLQQTRVVVGTDIIDLGAARLAALTDYLKAGGTMLLLCGDPGVRAYTNEKLLPSWTAARLGPFRNGREGTQRLIVSARDHPVFTGFEDDELATLEEVELRNYYPLPETVGRSLVRFADGGAAILEVEVGLGRVILCGFHTAATAGNLPYSPMFLPLMQRLAGYLATAGWSRYGRQAEVGSSLAAEAPPGMNPGAVLEVRLPDGATVPATLNATVTPPRLELALAEVPGAYTFLVDHKPWALCAVNVPGSESVRRFQEPEAFRKQYGGGDAARVTALAGDSAAEAVRQARRGYGIHRWLLALAGILLVIESLVARRVGAANAAAVLLLVLR